MIIIGADYHPSFQQIAWVDSDTGEFQERRLEHCEEAENFYRALAVSGVKVRQGMEASGHARWLIAKIAMARRLAVRLYWMWRKGWDYQQMETFGSHAGEPGHRDGVQQNTE